VAVRHVNVVERVFTLSNRSAVGDAEAVAGLIDVFHDDARIESHLYDVGDARGEPAIRLYLDHMAASYDDWRCVLDYVQDFGDRVLALGALRSAANGVREHEDALGWIFTFREEKIEAVKTYPSYGDALQAVTARPAVPSG
jgi:ketosteroid isomerase-like protein